MIRVRPWQGAVAPMKHDKRKLYLLYQVYYSRRLFSAKPSSSWRDPEKDVTTLLPQQIDLLERYRGLVALGRVQYDEDQVRVVMKLRRLQRELQDYTPVSFSSYAYWTPADSSRNNSESEHGEPESQSLWWIPSSKDEPEPSAVVPYKGHAEELASLKSPKGLLLIGPPGSGKTFLIDLWLSAFPTPYKARKHYNELVLELYRAVWEVTRERMSALSSTGNSSPGPTSTSNSKWKRHSFLDRLVPKLANRSRAFSDPPVAYVVAKRLILHHWLLVFDEIQLLDVSSANLLADVLSWYWRMGGVVVGTSNKVPEDLYKNGVQRDRLEPFVEALKVRCPLVNLEAKEDRDWRIVRAETAIEGLPATWFLKSDGEAFHTTLDKLLRHTSEPQSVNLSVFGRALHVPWSTGSICRYSFDQLCGEELGPADYLTLASTYNTVILDEVPIIKLSAKDKARRFISLIDALYEARCRVIIQAETSPDGIFFPDAGSQIAAQTTVHDADIMMAESVAETGDNYRPNVSSYDSPSMSQAPAERVLPLDTLSIFSGKDEQFAFKRALSRLYEMTSPSYNRDEVWNPIPLASRKWESTLDRRRWKSRSQSPGIKSDSIPQNEDDFAIEAAYESRDAGRETRPPPRVREHHIWGVRDDWGKGAGKWGQGTKVYDTHSSKDQ